jgi:hypothetical protein
MKPKDFKKLCKKENVKLEDLPFHLPASDDDLKDLIKKISKANKNNLKRIILWK